MPTFIDRGRVIAVFSDNGTPVMTQPPVSEWMRSGVPALQGVDVADGVVEQWVVVPPTDPFFDLCLLDQAERLGWTVVQDATPSTQNGLDALKERSTPDRSAIPFAVGALADRFVAFALKADPYHAPPGAPTGGQFTTGPHQSGQPSIGDAPVASRLHKVAPPKQHAPETLPVWPRATGIKVIVPSAKPETLDTITGIKDASSPENVARLVGGLDNAEVVVITNRHGVQYDVRHPNAGRWDVQVAATSAGAPRVSVELELKKDAPEGTFFGIMTRMLRGMRELGVRHFTLQSSKQWGDSAGTNTFLPQIGFDALIPTQYKLRLPAALAGARLVSDLYKTPEGQKAWADLNLALPMTFNLTPGSRSLAAFEAYLKVHAITPPAGAAGSSAEVIPAQKPSAPRPPKPPKELTSLPEAMPPKDFKVSYSESATPEGLSKATGIPFKSVADVERVVGGLDGATAKVDIDMGAMVVMLRHPAMGTLKNAHTWREEIGKDPKTGKPTAKLSIKVPEAMTPFMPQMVARLARGLQDAGVEKLVVQQDNRAMNMLAPLIGFNAKLSPKRFDQMPSSYNAESHAPDAVSLLKMEHGAAAWGTLNSFEPLALTFDTKNNSQSVRTLLAYVKDHPVTQADEDALFYQENAPDPYADQHASDPAFMQREADKKAAVEARKKLRAEKPVGTAQKADPYHAPKGSPRGGQFATGPKREAAPNAFPAIPLAKNMKVVFEQGSTPEQMGAVLGLKGPLTREIAENLMGGLDNATLSVKQVGMHRIQITGEHPYAKTWYRYFYLEHGKIHAHNAMIVLKVDAPPGTGTLLLARQVQGLISLGAISLTAEAAGGKGRPDNGYYTWARLGFDGDLPSSVRGEMAFAEVDLHKPKRVSDLMKTQKGREWWKEHGDTFEGTFDLTPGSQSLRVLGDYVRAKGIVQ